MRHFGSLFFLFAATSCVLACSSSSSDTGSCASDPFTCGSGQTCSVKDPSGNFACLASGAGKKGDACQNTIGVTGCGDGLVCLQLVQAGGTCSSFCKPGNAARGCATGETCTPAKLAGTAEMFYVCAGGAAPTRDAGVADAATD